MTKASRSKYSAELLKKDCVSVRLTSGRAYSVIHCDMLGYLDSNRFVSLALVGKLD